MATSQRAKELAQEVKILQEAERFWIDESHAWEKRYHEVADNRTELFVTISRLRQFILDCIEKGNQ